MKLRKIIAATLAAVMMLSLTISASAETIFDSATEIKTNTTYEVTLERPKGWGDYNYKTYKFVVNAKSTITLTANTDFSNLAVFLYNSDGVEMGQKNQKATSGDWSSSPYELNWNYKTEMAKGSADYTLQKGTYYIQFSQYYINNEGGNTLKFKITDPNASSVTALSLSLTVDVGDIIDLGGIVTPSNAKITWKSSDTEVATVSSTGEVEALTTGKAKITATAGGKTASITIIVN